MSGKIVTVHYEIDAMTDGVCITKDVRFVIEHTKTTELSELLEDWMAKVTDAVEIIESLKDEEGGEK